MTIAITGATGQLGRLVVAALKERAPADKIVALVRSPDKAKDLGVTARAFDYEQLESLAPALDGVDTLLLISSNEVGKRLPQHRNVIAAAKAAGVGRIVYTSLLRADTSALGLAPEHVETEAALKASGLAYTILRNGWYTDNYAGPIKAGPEHGKIFNSSGDGHISSAARADYAEAAAVVLAGTGHEGQTYELAGDTAWTQTELAAEVTRQSGVDVAYVNLSPDEYAKVLIGIGLPAALAHEVADWGLHIAEGALFDDGQTLSKLIGHPTTPLSTVVAAALK